MDDRSKHTECHRDGVFLLTAITLVLYKKGMFPLGFCLLQKIRSLRNKSLWYFYYDFIITYLNTIARSKELFLDYNQLHQSHMTLMSQPQSFQIVTWWTYFNALYTIFI